jgi:hypothetical protein
MCSAGSPDTPEKPDPAVDPADIFLGEQDTVQDTHNQQQGLRRFQLRPRQNKGGTGLHIT